jgi:hypothetical protein
LDCGDNNYKNSKENNAETPDGTIYALAICGQH